jgi:hypothetical protein
VVNADKSLYFINATDTVFDGAYYKKHLEASFDRARFMDQKMSGTVFILGTLLTLGGILLREKQKNHQNHVREK